MGGFSSSSRFPQGGRSLKLPLPWAGLFCPYRAAGARYARVGTALALGAGRGVGAGVIC